MSVIKPTKDCACNTCFDLRKNPNPTPMAQRIGQGAAVVLVVVLGVGGALLTALLLAWACVAVARQL